MNITINGKVISVLPAKNGVSKTGNEWMSQDYVIENESGEKFCFNVFGSDKIQEYRLSNGVIASITCKLESKEWNGRWFTSLSCVNAIVQANGMQSQARPQAPKTQTIQQPSQQSGVGVDTLPF